MNPAYWNEWNPFVIGAFYMEGTRKVIDTPQFSQPRENRLYNFAGDTK